MLSIPARPKVINPSPVACKILIIIAARSNRRGLLRTRVVDLAQMTCLGRAAVRGGIRELAETGWIAIEASSTLGYRVRLAYSRHGFTKLPEACVSLLMALPPAAVSAYLAIARLTRNTTGTARLLVDTIARYVGRGRRAVQMATSILARAGLVMKYRTPRSSYYEIVGQARDLRQREFFFAPRFAHHSALCVRILSSTPREHLSGSLPRIARMGGADVADAVRDTHPTMRATPTDERWMRKALRACGMSRDEADVLMARFTSMELCHALDGVRYRRVRRPSEWIRKALDRGWCAWV